MSTAKQHMTCETKSLKLLCGCSRLQADFTVSAMRWSNILRTVGFAQLHSNSVGMTIFCTPQSRYFLRFKFKLGLEDDELDTTTVKPSPPMVRAA
jgi:hypothetical protein